MTRKPPAHLSRPGTAPGSPAPAHGDGPTRPGAPTGRTEARTCRSHTVKGEVCGAPATHLVTAGCVHEHVRTGLACAEHAARIGKHWCGACYRLDGHLCRLLGRTEPIKEPAHA